MKTCMKRCCTNPTDVSINALGEFPNLGDINANLSVRVNGQILFVSFVDAFAGLSPNPVDSFNFNSDGEVTNILNVETNELLGVQEPFVVFTTSPNTPNIEVNFFVDFACIQDNRFRISTVDRQYLLVAPFLNGFRFTTTPEVREATIFTAQNITPLN